MSEDKLHEIDKRLYAMEIKLDSKVNNSRFATSTFAFILTGAILFSAIGYFDFRHIPNRIETVINEQIEPAVNRTIREDFERLMGSNYEDILKGLGNIEVGEVDIPHKVRPSGDAWEEIFRKYVPFESKFNNKPQVFISITSIEAYQRTTTTTYRTTVENLTRAGFDVVVSSAYLQSFSQARINWLAIDSTFRQLRSEQ